jgi:hypothetical protein
MDLRMLREAQDRVLERRKNANNHDIDLLSEFMDWLQENKHINKSKEYRRELCELFLTTRKSGEAK